MFSHEDIGPNEYLGFHMKKFYGAIITKWELLEQKLFLPMKNRSKGEQWFIYYLKLTEYVTQCPA